MAADRVDRPGDGRVAAREAVGLPLAPRVPGVGAVGVRASERDAELRLRDDRSPPCSSPTCRSPRPDDAAHNRHHGAPAREVCGCALPTALGPLTPLSPPAPKHPFGPSPFPLTPRMLPAEVVVDRIELFSGRCVATRGFGGPCTARRSSSPRRTRRSRRRRRRARPPRVGVGLPRPRHPRRVHARRRRPHRGHHRAREGFLGARPLLPPALRASAARRSTPLASALALTAPLAPAAQPRRSRLQLPPRDGLRVRRVPTSPRTSRRSTASRPRSRASSGCSRGCARLVRGAAPTPHRPPPLRPAAAPSSLPPPPHSPLRSPSPPALRITTRSRAELLVVRAGQIDAPEDEYSLCLQLACNSLDVLRRRRDTSTLLAFFDRR